MIQANSEFDKKTFKILNLRVENISARIDDIFFKENMTKLSLYKVELRLQKLEEFNYEAISQLNNLCNMLKVNYNLSKPMPNKNSETDFMTEYDPRMSLKASRRRNVTINDGNSYYNNVFSQLPKYNSRSSLRMSRSSHKNSSTENNNQERRDQDESNRLRPQLDEDYHVPSFQHQHSDLSHYKELKNRRKRMFSEGQSYEEAPSSFVARKTTPKKSNEKASDDETDPSKIKVDTDETIESKYLQEYAKKISNAGKSNLSSSSSSVSSLSKRKSKEKSTASEAHDENEDKPAINKQHRARKEASKTSLEKKSREDKVEWENESETDEEDVEKSILKKIYKSNLDQQALLTSQMSTGLDQYTIHPFVYLHSVIKPPLAEYTSITDCIDTSNIDRPPSPPVSSSVTNKPFLFSSLTNNDSSNKFLAGKLSDYCSKESARSVVARQESEILRLAEESQHVIISQMLNKLVKQTSVSSDYGDSASLATPRHKMSNENQLTSTIDEVASPKFTISSDTPSIKSKSMKTNQEDEDIVDLDMFAREESALSKPSRNSSSKPSINEENENRRKSTKSQASNRNKIKSNEPRLQSPPSAKLNIPLNAMDRNSSQIFYAQSQANVFCMTIDDEKEEEEIDEQMF